MKTNCKFCKCALNLEIDPSYDAIADPLKLLPLAACNRCADLRRDRARLLEKLSRLANIIISHNGKFDRDEEEAFYQKMLKLTRYYCGLVAEWKNKPFSGWSESLVARIMQEPASIGKVLEELWV